MAEFIRYPNNIGQPPFDKWIRFNAMTGRHVVRTKVLTEQNQADRPLASVGLYLSASALKSTLQISYEKDDLGPIFGAAVELLAQSPQNAAFGAGGGSGLQGITAGLSTVFDKAVELGTDGQTWADLMKVLGREFIEGEASRVAKYLDSSADPKFAASALFGAKVNPRTETLFKAQQYREHNMDFTMIPRSVDEARAIDRIISFFQFYSLPRYSAATANNGLGSYMIGFPYEFTIDMLAAQPNGTNVSLNHLNRIGRSVLTGVSIDHAAGGKTAFVKDDGEYYPVASTIHLSFQEVRLLARGDNEIKRNSDTDVGPALDEFPDPRA
jgi:hypothetical protein